MLKIPSTRLVREHLALRAGGVTSFYVRQQMIVLAHLRAHNFEAWIKARGKISISQLLQIESERGMPERSSNGKCAFWGALNKSKGVEAE